MAEASVKGIRRANHRLKQTDTSADAGQMPATSDLRAAGGQADTGKCNLPFKQWEPQPLTLPGITRSICESRLPTYREAESPDSGCSSLLEACSRDCRVSPGSAPFQDRTASPATISSVLQQQSRSHQQAVMRLLEVLPRLATPARLLTSRRLHRQPPIDGCARCKRMHK